MSSVLVNGAVVQEPKQILDAQVRFYEKLYKKDTSIHFDYINEENINIEHNERLALEQPFTIILIILRRYTPQSF